MKIFEKLNHNPIFWLINVVLCFVLLNLFISDFSFRKDLSVNNRFDLTESTEKVLKNLKSNLYIEAFYSEDIPGEYKARLNITKELLKEIANVNKEKVSLRFYNPDKDEKIEKRAVEIGIAPQTLQKVERGAAQVQQAFFGVSLRLGTKTEVLPVLFFAEELEYQFLTALKKMTRKSQNSGIGVLQGSDFSTYPQPGRFSNKDTFGAFIHQIVQEQFGTVETVDINEKAVPEELLSLLWVGAGNLTEKGQFHLDQYLMRGGKLLILGKSMNFQLRNNQLPGSFSPMQNQQGFATPVSNFDKIQNFTKHYGFQIEQNMVVEKNNSMPMGALVQVSPGVIGRYHYPLWIIASQEQGMINRNNPYSKDIKSLLLPWTGSIMEFPNSQKNVKITTLIQTTSEAQTKKNFILLGEEQLLKEKFDDIEKPLKLAIHLKGKFQSYFKKNNLPEGVSSDDFLTQTKNKEEAEIVVLGTPYLISDILAFPEYREIFQETNIPFILNLFDLFEGDTDLIKARSKKSVVLNLKPFSKIEEIFYSFLNILVPPILIGLVAFIRIRRRIKSTNQRVK